jgi:hypothetical protein
MKSTMKSSSPLRPRARATAIALALAALCASFVPTARAQNNFYALEELQTPPAVRERRSRRPARALPSPRVASVAPAQTAPFPPRPPPPPPTRRRAAQISWLYPPKGHIIGGTVVTIYGSGFKRSATGKVREPRRESTSSSRGPYHPPSRS